MPHRERQLICETCRRAVTLPTADLDVSWASGLYWHRPCVDPAVRQSGRDGPGRLQPVPVARLRPALAWFAGKMEEVLRNNDWKGGWEALSPEEALERLAQEVAELKRADGPAARILEAADVANSALILADLVRQAVEVPLATPYSRR